MKLKSLITKKFTSDFIWSFTSLGVTSVVGILLNILLGNYYGVEGLGIYNFAFSFYIFLATLSIFGLKSSTTKYTGELYNNPWVRCVSIRGSLLSTVVISFIITLFASFFISLNIGNRNYYEISIILISLPFYSVNEVMFGYINGLRKMKFYSITRALRWLLIIALFGVNILLRRTIIQALYSFLITELVLMVLFFLSSRELFSMDKSALKFWIKKHISFGSKIVLIESVNQLNTQLSVMILGALLTKADVGIYSLASSISSGLLMIPGTVALNFNPVIANLWKNDKDKLSIYIKEVRKWTLIITLPLFGLGALVYPFFIKFAMKGDKYNTSIPIFYILLLGNFCLILVRWVSGILTMTGHPGEQLKIKTMIVILNLVINLALIKSFGIIGAAWATTITNIIWTGILILLIKKKLDIRIL